MSAPDTRPLGLEIGSTIDRSRCGNNTHCASDEQGERRVITERAEEEAEEERRGLREEGGGGGHGGKREVRPNQRSSPADHRRRSR